MKKLLILLLLLQTFTTKAQTTTGAIKGQVLDKSTKEPIPFANLLLLKDSMQVSGLASDFDGNYHFQNLDPGRYAIRVIFIGYQQIEISEIKVIAEKITFLNIELNRTAIELKSFEKVESETRLISRENASMMTVVRGSEVHRRPGRVIKGKAIQAYSTNYYNEQNNESYEHYRPNQFEHVYDSPLSTFSIDVDGASYSNARRFIQQGKLPSEDAVRTEEFINYFSYEYSQPSEGHPFSVTTELGPCPWNSRNKLLHIGLQGGKIEKENLPPGNFVFLIDVSGSMAAPNRLQLVKKSLALLINELRREDKISIVVYAGAAGLVLEPTPGAKKDKILDALEKLSAGGSTAGGQGIQLAYKTAKENFMKNGNNRVILATDGDFNVGVSSDQELVKLIEDQRDEGIFLTVLGYGMGNYKDSKLEKLANKGNGNYAYIDNLQEANKVLVNELGATLFTIAKDVKIQVEFNPALVKGYRLVGYENRMLEAKDFNDDKKDAGEMGAGHSVTAIYELIVSNDGITPKVDPLKYQKKMDAKGDFSEDEFATVKLRYKEPKESKSKLLSVPVRGESLDLASTTNDFRFSAAVAQFGMLLSRSEYLGSADYENTLSLARYAKGNDMEGYRAEFIRLVELASRLDTERKTVKK